MALYIVVYCMRKMRVGSEKRTTLHSIYLQSTFWLYLTILYDLNYRSSLHCTSSQDYVVLENQHVNTEIRKQAFKYRAPQK